MSGLRSPSPNFSRALHYAVALGLAGLVSCGTPDSGTPAQTGGSSNASGSGGGGGSGGNATGGAGASSGGSAGQGTGGSTSGSGGSGGTNPVVVNDSYASNVSVTVHEEVNTILVVDWTQAMAAESVWLEFTFENGELMTSHPQPGTVGPLDDVVLGIPELTTVTIRIVSRQGGVDYKSSDYMGTTEALPAGLPRPEVLEYNAALASPERWMLAAVEDSLGGRCEHDSYNQWIYWTYIMDRQGRVVWYYADPVSNATSSYQRIAKDGQYIWIEKRPFGPIGTYGVLKMTLDWAYFEEIPVPGLADCIDVTPSGSLLFDRDHELVEMTFPDGNVRPIWNCEEHFNVTSQCYNNTINYNAADDTVLMSFPELDTVVQIDRETGALVGQYGSRPGSYAFSPASAGFEFNHFPNISPAGTLMISTHLPGNNTYEPVANQHAFMEFSIDRNTETLTQLWSYTAGPEWAMFKGMAVRLANGNTLANYGSGGTIREITPDGQTAFRVKYDALDDEIDGDFCNKMVGHNELVEDLYDLNGGPQ